MGRGQLTTAGEFASTGLADVLFVEDVLSDLRTWDSAQWTARQPGSEKSAVCPKSR